MVQGRRTDNNSTCTVVVIHKNSGSWAIHGLGNPGVRLPTADMSALTEAILARTLRHHCTVVVRHDRWSERCDCCI